ncbi:MAG: DUF262 domain-containing protein [Bacteroidetes bacterium]|nr:MAG: DUF262 domain-containing protein [Bacteroidota bacterium]
MDTATLINSIDKTILTVRTSSADFSFNELAEMYKDQELIISPEFQRLFRWSETLQSQFIESIILELPIPPIFVVERQGSRIWELIDGLQRISSWLHFKGLLREEGELLSPLCLKNCDIIEGLNGLTFETLPQAIKLKIKRSPIRVEIIGKDSSSRLKYDMFNRLNTNGLTLSPQEIRNATIRLLDSGDKFMRFIIKLSENNYFKTCISSVAEYDIRRKSDQELVLRFFALKNGIEKYEEQLSEFMTQYAELVAEKKHNFDYIREEKIFEKTFKILKGSLGKDIFRSSKNGQYRAFYFEAFTLGIQKFLEQIEQKHYSKLGENFRNIKEDKDFKMATSTKDGSKRKNLKKRIELIENIVEKILTNS